MLPSDQPQYSDSEQVLLFKAVYWLSQISATGLTPSNARVTEDEDARITESGLTRIIE